VTTSVPFERSTGAPFASEHDRLALVAVGAFDARAIAAIGYARTLPAWDRRAVHVATDRYELDLLADVWMRRDVGIPLDVIEPVRGSVPRSLADYVREQRREGRDEVVVVMGRVALRSRTHRLLHDRTADKIARALRKLDGVATSTITVGRV
jgi:hypothetical protein